MDLKPDLKLKICLAFLVQPFMVDIINNSLQISEMQLTETSTAEWNYRKPEGSRLITNGELQSNSRGYCQKQSICKFQLF
jgi:hypothetical protein